MLHQRRSRVFAALLSCVLLLGAFPGAAFAGINDYPSDSLGTSTTNPFDLDDPTAWWRMGWGNNPQPQFFLNLPDGTSTSTWPEVLGIYYVVDRTTGTEIDQDNVSQYAHTTAVGDSVPLVFDVRDVYSSNPALYAPVESGARLPFEGQWWLHWSFYDTTQVASRTIEGPFGIDVTPPLPVSKLNSKPYQAYTGPTGIWFAETGSYVVWEDKEYDALSGTAAYEIYVNDELQMNGTEPRYVFHLGHSFTSISLEDLPPGKNKITVKTVDRATNRGPAVTTYFYSDPDVPVVDITSPAANGLAPRVATFKADATDGAGIQYVQFYIDGVHVNTDSVAPYQYTRDMLNYANGTHTLLVKAKDMFGREVTDSVDFTLDKTAPGLSSISDSSDPFYPILQDGYKDTSTVSFYVNEKVYAYVHYYKANGELFTSRSAPRGPGWGSIVWNGMDLEGNVGIGDYRYRVAVKDTAGNETWSGTYTSTIRDYELVRVAPNAVKVIPR